MIIKRDAVVAGAGPGPIPEFGPQTWSKVSDAGGITQYGAFVVTLEPGSRSSNRHWHEREDELLWMLSGEAVIVEDDGEHVVGAGDVACWPAGVANAHQVKNRGDRPCSYLIVGARVTHDVCRYPDLQRTLYTEGETWRYVDDETGAVLKSGKT